MFINFYIFVIGVNDDLNNVVHFQVYFYAFRKLF